MDNDYIMERKKSYDSHLPFDVEAWCNILSGYTAESEFIPINESLAKAFINYYQNRFNSKDVFTKEDYLELQRLENELSSVMKQFGSAFVRLSSRSPKDGMPLEDNGISEEYERIYSFLKEKYPPSVDLEDANLKFVACSEAQGKSLKMSTAPHAMNMMLTSERVFVDLLRIIDVPQPWRMNVVVRKWNDLIKDSMEFRIFVKNERIICISQYNHYCVFPRILEKYGKNEAPDSYNKLLTTVCDYWSIIHSKLIDTTNVHHNETYIEAYKNGYILDVGVIEKENNVLDCTVIELNPYERTTGSSLFNWNEIDRLSENNDIQDIELRFLTKPREGIDNLIDDIILPAVHQQYTPYYDFYKGYNQKPSLLSNIISFFK